MTASELTAARERLGLSADDLASALGVHRDVYAMYEDGRDKPTGKQRQLVAWHLAAAEREQALDRSGLPSCEWIEQWEREEPAADARLEEQVAYDERAAAHAATCDVCQARERFVAARFPVMPEPPMPTWVRLVGDLTEWIHRRPEWLRPAIWGALILAGMTSFRAVFMLIGGAREPRLLLMAGGAIVAASAAGAGGGLVYSLLGRPVRRVPVVGPYLAGIVAVAGYMGCILGLLALIDRGGDSTGSSGSLLAFGLASLIFGPLVGHQLLRPEKATG